MRVLIISHPVDTPSTKYRVLQYLPLFQADGIEVERVDVPDSLLGRWKLLRRCADFDVVLHQKRLLPAWQFRALRKAAKRLVYDFDDPMPYHREGERVELSQTRARRFRAAIGAADAVVVNHAGTEALAREYGGSNVHVIPTSVKLDRWTPRTSWETQRLTLGWVGSPSNLPALRAIAPALRGRRLKLVTDVPLELPGVDVEFVKWDYATEPGEVRTFDIALAPLMDDAWSRGKMPFKILYYFAAAVPVIASRLGAVETVVRDGENGLLAGDWEAIIRRLEGDLALRERLGRAGRRTVEAGFSMEASYAKLRRLLETLHRR